MKQNKLVYQAPEAEIFEVRTEGYLCSSPNNSRGLGGFEETDGNVHDDTAGWS